jgi:excisionase family DNA binding protein
MEQTYFDVNAISGFLGVSKSTIYSYVNKNRIPFAKLGGKLLFDKNDITRWMASKKNSVETLEGKDATTK